MKPKKGANEFMEFGGQGAFEPTPLERHLQTQNLAKLVGKTIFDLINNPPKINRLPHDETVMTAIIQNSGVEENETHLQTDLTLTIPLNGEPLRELFQKTGLEDLDAILERLNAIAVEERMGIIVAYDDGEALDDAAGKPSGEPDAGIKSVIVNLHRPINLAHYPRMKEENEDFLNLFEWELF